MMMRYQHYIEKAHRTSSVKENDFSKQNEDTAWLCTCYYTLIFDKAANYNKYISNKDLWVHTANKIFLQRNISRE